jgi:hypothetical protein
MGVGFEWVDLTTEKEIEDECILFFEAVGIMVYKTPKYAAKVKNMRKRDKGGPDLWLLYQGVVMACEIKRPGEKQSDEQIDFEVRLRRQKIPYHLCYSKSDAQVLFKVLKEHVLNLSSRR